MAVKVVVWPAKMLCELAATVTAIGDEPVFVPEDEDEPQPVHANARRMTTKDCRNNEGRKVL